MVEYETNLRRSNKSNWVLTVPKALLECKVLDPNKPVFVKLVQGEEAFFGTCTRELAIC